ncbi:MAG: hypothetical protein WAK93_07240 [Solirubrobacteraceae bacterium]
MEDCELVVVVAGTVVVTVGVVVVVEADELELVVVEFGGLPDPGHCRSASCPTVAAPWPRF